MTTHVIHFRVFTANKCVYCSKIFAIMCLPLLAVTDCQFRRFSSAANIWDEHGEENGDKD